jgi:hypothetical protein
MITKVISKELKDTLIYIKKYMYNLLLDAITTPVLLLWLNILVTQ